VVPINFSGSSLWAGPLPFDCARLRFFARLTLGLGEFGSIGRFLLVEAGGPGVADAVTPGFLAGMFVVPVKVGMTNWPG
jgi:hypothetical protein